MDKNSYFEQMNEVEARWSVFIAKMEERLSELLEASIPELEEAFRNDADTYKRTYHSLRRGIAGQMNTMLDKANAVKKENVLSLFEAIRDRTNVIDDNALHSATYKFREKCYKRLEDFEKHIDNANRRIEATEEEDLEAKYKHIIDEYERIKDKFVCKQCGSGIKLEKLFITTTYIECPACRVQNTFEPSSEAKNLDYVAQKLSEERTYHLLQDFERENNKERELYHQQHELKLKRISFEIERNKEKLKELQDEIDRLEAERVNSIAKAPELYKIYLKAQFEEWIRLVPELEEQNRKVYESRLKSYENRH